MASKFKRNCSFFHARLDNYWRLFSLLMYVGGAGYPLAFYVCLSPGQKDATFLQASPNEPLSRQSTFRNVTFAPPVFPVQGGYWFRDTIALLPSPIAHEFIPIQTPRISSDPCGSQHTINLTKRFTQFLLLPGQLPRQLLPLSKICNNQGQRVI